MKTYLDSSFLFSLYALDDHSVEAASTVGSVRGELVLSSLAEVELINALELRVFRKEFSRAEVTKAHTAFESDIQRGALRVVDVSVSIFNRTKALILQNTASIGCRTADILHVAAAVEMNVDKFLTFDQRQKQLAQRLKLSTN